jgi:hypothetical protein
MEAPEEKVWTPAQVDKTVQDTQTDADPRPTPMPEAEAENAQPLPYLTGRWVRLNDNGRIAKIIGFGSPPPFDYAAIIATPTTIQRNNDGTVVFITPSSAVTPLVNGTFVVLDDSVDIIDLVAHTEE